jgi:restriction endonuclease S subunit
MWKIGAEDIQNFPIPIPPLDVQRGIVDMVAKRRDEIAAARQAAAKKSAEITQEVEDMILGKRKV